MVLSGLDAFLKSAGRSWRKARLGLVCHPASVTSRLEPAPDALVREGFKVAALFAPEHGAWGALQDQVSVRSALHPRLKIPVHSLYGDPTDPAQFARLSPSPESLKRLDALLFDLQDVGVRYYTFVWTMALAMKACRNARKPFIVLDRPNPLGGKVLEGNLPDPRFLSFVGLYPVPVRHGLTAAELARHLNKTIGAELHAVPMRGWRRGMWFEDTGLPWVMPSPNMPTPDTAAVYAGMCLLEGTNLSEGRGTTRPFEIVGAPFIDGAALAREMDKASLPGVRFRPSAFQPSFHKWAGQSCGGVQIHVTDRRRFPSFLTGLALIAAVRRLWPGKFRWKAPPYEFVTDKPPFDLLCGTDEVRLRLSKGRSPESLEAAWRDDRRRFRAAVRPSFLYGENG